MMTKMKIVFSLFFLITCFIADAQKVSNIRAEQRGQEIVVLYSLETTSPCDVSLLLSQDNGVTWSTPLKNVSGDVGNNVSSGDKQIIWKVLEEQEQLVGEKYIFKIIANDDYLFHPEMVFVEGGTFQMGSSSGEENEKAVHAVTLSSFNIGKYEVTQLQWKAVMGSNPSYFKDCDECPVESVSWSDVQVFIQKLNERNGNNYRLPTEAEWEYAAKGGKYSKGYTYSGSNDLNSVAWWALNFENKTHRVGGRQANELGIYDMTGNVWKEWCSDWYAEYKIYNATNPVGPSSGFTRVLRGGGWSGFPYHWRTTMRSGDEPNSRNSIIGFRLALPAE